MSDSDPTYNELESFLMVQEGKPKSIDASTVLRAMESNSIEIQGLLNVLFAEKRHRDCIKPQLDYLLIAKCRCSYLIRCIQENPDCEWTESSYSAGWALAALLQHYLKNQDPRYQKLVSDSMNTIKKTLNEKNLDQRKCIVIGFLEHVVVDRGIRRLISNWKDSEVAGAALKMAMNRRIPMDVWPDM